jgi:hypothetical protein
MADTIILPSQYMMPIVAIKCYSAQAALIRDRSIFDQLLENVKIKFVQSSVSAFFPRGADRERVEVSP